MVNLETLEGQCIYLAKKEAWNADDRATKELLSQGVPVEQSQMIVVSQQKTEEKSLLQRIFHKR
ncbi:hypothetical protein A2971_00190 [Candidatus Gottesmanbacteria bacterium RIFCSPLOWO2_01_FULL_46_21]|uniref:Uncharacterized protein n=2 Tax=Microgenomates group TaxID=1794810 RepID=A0A0G0WE43_9BACT|nr:MAG: hypothetical protein UU67_C0081G0002 [Candidatus Daviesbacteria bacterium GW2011_GWB1_41_5]OGG28733.1 MAG: hypothetical protein A2971_00190 [Candidatus Gottesmanbacteria bacterium RIFCSPLOWO2_01_FULL_46_21]